MLQIRFHRISYGKVDILFYTSFSFNPHLSSEQKNMEKVYTLL